MWSWLMLDKATTELVVVGGHDTPIALGEQYTTMRGNQCQKYTSLELGWYFAIGCILEHNRSHVL